MVAKFRNVWEALWGPGHDVFCGLQLSLNVLREMSAGARWYSIWIPPFQKPPKIVQNLPPCFVLDMDNGCAWVVKRREMNTMKEGETKQQIVNVLKHGVIGMWRRSGTLMGGMVVDLLSSISLNWLWQRVRKCPSLSSQCESIGETKKPNVNNSCEQESLQSEVVRYMVCLLYHNDSCSKSCSALVS